jgi:chemosensory pili system protein ChpC
MAEEEQPDQVTSLLVPMQGRPWLIPNILVAEVIGLRQPERSASSGPQWLLGWLSWRDVEVPLISFEAMNEASQPQIGQDARIVVLNTISGKNRFYAMVIQGIPRTVKVESEDLVEEPVDTGPVEAMSVQVGGDLAVMPDLDAIEDQVAELNAP